jgi:hypothetical protein
MLTPTPALLFHYSALTYNAHRIHLDSAYCREVEGYRDLLVHGPLSLTLMLSVLQSQLSHDGNQSEFIDAISYRHIAPLYVGQPMRICVALQLSWVTKIGDEENASDEAEKLGKGEEPGITKKWEIWIENQDGGLCVRGTVTTEKRRMLSSQDRLSPLKRNTSNGRRKGR